MKIGIIIAMDKESQRIKALLADTEEPVRNGRVYVTGNMGDNTLIMHQCGIGKVNAAIGATDMINAFAPDVVISTGVAGGADTNLNVQEVVASTQTCYPDA